MKAFAEMVTIGRVVRPQGRRGELLTEPLSDRPERFPELRRAYVLGPDGAARAVAVAGCWPHKGRFVLKLEGVDSIDAAETLRGAELRIAEDELLPLPEGSYYHHQLHGLAVVDAARGALGRVAEILDAGAAPVLVVRDGAAETLIPLAAPFVRAVDLAAGRLEVEFPEALT